MQTCNIHKSKIIILHINFLFWLIILPLTFVAMNEKREMRGILALSRKPSVGSHKSVSSNKSRENLDSIQQKDEPNIETEPLSPAIVKLSYSPKKGTE